MRYTVSSEIVGTRSRTAPIERLDVRVLVGPRDVADHLEPLMGEAEPRPAKGLREQVHTTLDLFRRDGHPNTSSPRL